MLEYNGNKPLENLSDKKECAHKWCMWSDLRDEYISVKCDINFVRDCKNQQMLFYTS